MTRLERKAARVRWWRRARDRERSRRRYAALRARAFAMLGGCCAICGSLDDLELDHIDPDAKTMEFCRPTLARFWIELEGAQLLCASCHVDKTTADMQRRRQRRKERRAMDDAPF